MKSLKPFGGLALAVLAAWILLAIATLAGVGVDTQLLGSDWQIPGLVTALFLLAALAGYAALGQPWHDMDTPYW